MDSNRFLGTLKTKGKNVEWLSLEMTKKGRPISESTIYKKLRGESQFNAPEIKMISDLLEFDKEEMFIIFFEELVS